jgi:adenylyltransferase/sulfurtransferase
MLSKEEKHTYIRQIMLNEIGLEGQLKLKQTKVAVVGAGGLGCPVLMYLASCGIGTIGIIDFDTVDRTNLHRQVLYGSNDVGKKKALAAAERLTSFYPEINFTVHNVMLNESNVQEIFANYDLVVDGCDNFATRYVVNDACVQLNIPLVYGSILGFEGQLAVFNCEGSKNLRDIFPESPNPEDVLDCSENGVLGIVPGLLGTMMANEVLKAVLGLPVLQNKLLLYNSLNTSITLLKY